jgi:hypothetical protein
MSEKTLPILLEYCGGEQTDRLYEALSSWNPETALLVLDNGSPNFRCKCSTHRRPTNSFVGGGIKHCIALAREHQADYLLFIVNDVIPLTKIDFKIFERLMEQDSEIVLAGTSVSADSDKAAYYKWMIHQPESEVRLVIHCDLLFCIIRLDFIDTFGGFPESRSGYGFDFEIAYQAKIQNKKIAVIDRFVCQHSFNSNKSKHAFEPGFNKIEELKNVYNTRYGNWEKINPFSPLFPK